MNIFDFGVLTNWFDNLLESVMPSWAATVVECGRASELCRYVQDSHQGAYPT